MSGSNLNRDEALGATWWNELSLAERDHVLDQTAAHVGPAHASVAAAWELWKVGKITMTPSPVAGWKIGEPPKDGRLYVAFGRIIWADKYGGGSTPFLAQVRYASREDWKGWLNEDDLAISSNIEDRVHIDHWIALPDT